MKDRRIILLVEDDDNDVLFFNRAMARTGLAWPIHVVNDGQEALDYLGGAGNFRDREANPLPDCIFLDLKLPLVHGFEIFEWLLAQPSLCDIPVFILTSSPEERDRQRAAELGAKRYLVKPPTPEVLTEALHTLSALNPVGVACL